jgi:hypothetical protein
MDGKASVVTRFNHLNHQRLGGDTADSDVQLMLVPCPACLGDFEANGLCLVIITPTVRTWNV